MKKVSELFQKPYWKFSTYMNYPCYTCSKCNLTVLRPTPACPSCRRKVLLVSDLKGNYVPKKKRKIPNNARSRAVLHVGESVISKVSAFCRSQKERFTRSVTTE